jgi:hypothetical protein
LEYRGLERPKFAVKGGLPTSFEKNVKKTVRKFVASLKVALKLQQVVFVFICLG